MSMGQTAAVLTLVPCPLQVTSPRVVAGDGVEGAALGWVWQGGLRRRGLKCTVHVWCLSCHSGHLMLLSPPTPPCFTSFINVPNCEASASSGGLWWLVLPGAKMEEALQALVPCVTHSEGAPGEFCPPMSHREPGKELYLFLLSSNTLGPLPPYPLPG